MSGKKIKIWYENPVPSSEASKPLKELLQKNISKMVREGTEVDIKFHETGFHDPTFSYTMAYNAIYGMQAAYKAEKKGYDAVVVGCFLDPGLRESRSIVNIPVTGVAESALYVAYSLGSKCSIISINPAVTALLENLVKMYGMENKVVCITDVGFTSRDAIVAYSNPEKLIDIFVKKAQKTIEEYKAEVLIPGCTILSSLLTNQGINIIEDAPLVDPVMAGIKMAEILVDFQRIFGMGVCRRTIYSAYPDWEKEIPIKID